MSGNMNARFHTPSFGDEVVFDLKENDDDDIKGGNNQPQLKQMRDMDHSLSPYQNSNCELAPSSSNVLSTTASSVAATTLATRKQMQTSSDPNEPSKPISAYGLFFRDTVSAIKQQNPKCSFPELSRIVSSMWEALDENNKTIYNAKNEVARNEYMKQMRIYRQQQHKQQHMETNDAFSNAISLQTKPAVFTITRFNANETDASRAPNNITPEVREPPIEQISVQMMSTNAFMAHKQPEQVHQKPQVYVAAPEQSQQQADNLNRNTNDGEITNTSSELQSSQPYVPADLNASTSLQQIQMLTEAGSAQMCTREGCNKRAIINPDWEDEYCSNECVVIHCRNVFNGWVQSNLESRVTSTTPM